MTFQGMRAAAIAGLGILILAGTGCQGNGNAGAPSGPSAAPQASDVSSAPAFTLPDLNGKQVSLAGLKGQVVFVDFWATWCPPCRYSIPALEALHREFQARGFQVVGVSLDENTAAVAPFVKEKGITYTVLLGGESDVADLYGVRGIPSLYLIDKEGRVARRWVGYDPKYDKEWRDSIAQLLSS